MFARITSPRSSPESIEERIRLIEKTLAPEAGALAGFVGGTWCVERSSGRFPTITLWDSEDEMRESEGTIAALRDDAARQVGGELEWIQHFEVVHTIP